MNIAKMIGNVEKMMDNYQDRKVADKYEDGDKQVSTCSVTDGELEFETAITHPDYNDGEFVIVEAYATKDEAIIGHRKWIGIIESDYLPDTLTDVDNAGYMGGPFEVKRAAKPEAGAASGGDSGIATA